MRVRAGVYAYDRIRQRSGVPQGRRCFVDEGMNDFGSRFDDALASARAGKRGVGGGVAGRRQPRSRMARVRRAAEGSQPAVVVPSRYPKNGRAGLRPGRGSMEVRPYGSEPSAQPTGVSSRAGPPRGHPTLVLAGGSYILSLRLKRALRMWYLGPPRYGAGVELER